MAPRRRPDRDIFDLARCSGRCDAAHNPKVEGSNPSPATQFDRFPCPIRRMSVREGRPVMRGSRTSHTPMLSRSGVTPGASGAALRKSAKPSAASRESNTIRARPWRSERSVQYPATKPGSPETRGISRSSPASAADPRHRRHRRPRHSSPASTRVKPPDYVVRHVGPQDEAAMAAVP